MILGKKKPNKENNSVERLFKSKKMQMHTVISKQLLAESLQKNLWINRLLHFEETEKQK